MFTAFFYLLRARNISVSLDEWMTLIDGLKRGLHGMSLTGFYTLCRAVVVKSEADYDKFDLAFMEFFYEIAHSSRELPPGLMDWLNHPEPEQLFSPEQFQQMLEDDGMSMEEIIKRFEERLLDQDDEHNGGSKWIGRDGYSHYGNNGKVRGGIRVGGQSKHRSAFMVAGDRRFRDFRKDNTLDTYQFQMAFRQLRQQSELASEDRSELDIDHTIEETSKQAGTLNIVYRRPRRNSIKVLLLMDSGGSMDYYAKLCSLLFQSAAKSNTFKDLKVYYFHNCPYERLHTEPSLMDTGVETQWVLQNLDSEYRVIIVGDAMMAPQELHQPRYHWQSRSYIQETGQSWLDQIQAKYPHVIWLNPQPRDELHPYWAQTYDQIARQFPMFDLTVEGLEAGIKKLLVKR